MSGHFPKALLSKIFANGFNLVLNLLMAILLPKSLGIALFGMFEYIMEVATQIMTFLQLNMRNYFLDELTKTKNAGTFYWFLLILFIAFLVSLLLVLTGFSAYNLNNSYDTSNWLLAIIVSISFVVLLISSLRSVGDAIGHTTYIEWYHTFYKIVLALCISVFYFLKLVPEWSVFLAYLFVGLLFSFLIISKIRKLLKEELDISANTFFSFHKFKSIFYDTKPLLMYSLLTFIVDFIDRSTIQFIGGNEQQAYFGIANRFSVIAFMLSSSVNPLIFREFSRASAKNDVGLISDIISNFMIILFVFSSVIGIFLAVNASDILKVFYGDDFTSGAFVFALLSIYPLQQTYGQLLSLLFYSTERIKSYRNQAVASTILGLILSYVFLMPHSFGGMDLSSVGLAFKRIITQFFGVTIGLIFFQKHYNFSVKYIYFNMLKAVIFLFALSVAVNFISSFFQFDLVVSLMVKMFVYVIFSTYVFFIYRNFFGLSRVLNWIIKEFNVYKNSR